MNLNRNFYEADLWPNLHLYWTNLAKFEPFQPFLILLCMKDTSAISGLIYESFSNFSLLGNAKKVPILTISFHENVNFNIFLFYCHHVCIVNYFKPKQFSEFLQKWLSLSFDGTKHQNIKVLSRFEVSPWARHKTLKFLW